MAIATFAAGCFWGVQARFSQLTAVSTSQVGYIGGQLPHPSYEQVCQGNTGHAEAITLSFDSTLLSYDDLLAFFWQVHDPTTLNRQGPDRGTQYRSAIFYHDNQQYQMATAMKQQLNQTTYHHQPIVTEITAATTFYPAEDYHQHYLALRGQ